MKILIIALFMTVGMTSWAQKAPKSQIIVIHTSAECTQCEARLEEGLNFTKGVTFAELDLTTQDISVKYNPRKTSPEALKKVINDLGYDADGQKADPTALDNLPACCKPGGMEHKK